MIHKKYIIALDQGTTSSRCALINRAGSICKIHQEEFEQIFPEPGWVEHNPQEIWASQNNTLHKILDDIDSKEVAALGITNQRETTILWNKSTGQPIYNAIVWQDRRTADYCNRLKQEGHEEMIRNKTGLILDAYFSATKIKWVLDHVPEAKILVSDNKLAFGTVDSWLIYKLTGEKKHFTDVTNASRTMLYNIHTGMWDETLLDLFGIPKSILPEVKDCNAFYGNHEMLNIPIHGVAGDQQSALFGQRCTEEGDIKCTYGTGCFLMMNTGEHELRSSNNLLSTIAWSINGNVNYAIEGSVFVGGAVIQWLRDGLNLIQHSADSEALALTEKDNGGVYFVPALTGLGAPHWNPNARGLLIGLTRATTKGHIGRAALESIAFQVRDLIEAIKLDTRLSINHLKVDGGAVSNKLLMQFQADILSLEVKCPENAESTVMGAAYFAGLGCGFWKDLSEINNRVDNDLSFVPSLPVSEATKKIKYWEKAVGRSLDWMEK